MVNFIFNSLFYNGLIILLKFYLCLSDNERFAEASKGPRG